VLRNRRITVLFETIYLFEIVSIGSTNQSAVDRFFFFFEKDRPTAD
jgi:hypothetical protein